MLIHTKAEINNNTIIVGGFNSPLTSTDRSFRQKTNKETMALNATLNPFDLLDIYRAFHQKNSAGYTFFSSTHGTFSRIDHMPGHKTSLNKFKKIETISSTFSDHNGVKLEINYRKKMEPPLKYVEIKHASKKPNGSRRK